MTTKKSKIDIYAEVKKYYLEIRLKDNPAVIPKDDWEKAFSKAVDFCYNENIEPYDFVMAQYRNRPRNCKEFYPTCLVTAHTKKNCAEYENIKKRQLEISFGVQKKYLLSQLQLGKTVEEALSNDNINFHPWFRVIITKEPIPAVMDKYQKTAKETIKPDMLAYLDKLSLDITRLK